MRRIALGQSALPLKERRLSLLCLVLLDYARHKLEILLDQWKTNQVSPNSIKVSQIKLYYCLLNKIDLFKE
jgi:hypothetical protein